MTETQALLAEFVQSRSETAFRELVSRYLNLVYSTALRLVGGDAHRAQDVAQTVFLHLAQKAHTLRSDSALGGWLHRDTCHAAATLMRTERRRQQRELQAVAMNSLTDHSAANLAQLTPVLDDAINQLPADDRAAILLRFYEQRDFRSVGEALGSSENAAQKRVARALDELRSLLQRRGVALSAAALGTVLTAEVVKAAPAGLVSSVATTAIAGASAKTALTLNALKLMTASNLKTVLVGAIVLAGMITPAFVYQSARARIRDQQQALQLQSSQLAAAQTENIRTAGDPRPATSADSLSHDQFNELLRLRSEVGRLRQSADTLRRAKMFRDSDAQLSADQVWPARERRLKQWLAEHPAGNIPEIALLNDKTWLNSIFPNALETDDDCRHAMTIVRANAESHTLNDLSEALYHYSSDRNGQWPTDLSQLQPYFARPMDTSILARYAIVPASSLVPELQPGGDWAITESAPIDEYDSRNALSLTNERSANSLVTNRWTFVR